MPPYNIQKRDSVKLADMDADEGLRENSSAQELLGDAGPTVAVVVPGGAGPGQQPQEDEEEEEEEEQQGKVTKTQIITVVILCYVNLINYMDRYTVAGILYDIQKSFDMTDAQAGLLQTSFIIVYMLMAPLYGYLGDRYNRKYLMAVGIFLWSLSTLIGSFMKTYEWFLVFRCLVGIGEASYSTISPTIISDMFVKDRRSTFLAIFYFAIPVGSGLGYIIGAEVTNLVKEHGDNDLEAWRWGLRVTPIMGLVAFLLILLVLREPPRGASEGGQHLQSTSFLSDLRNLFTNKSFLLSTLAFTCVTFVTGALAFWGPIFVQLGVKIQGDSANASEEDVAFIFGATAMVAGLMGVPLGSFLGQKLRVKYPYADPMVCGIGLLMSVPLIIAGMWMAEFNTMGAYAVVFLGQVFLNLNWAVVSDIVLYIVIPTRRSSAEAFQILFSHALGDAGSPTLIGVVADSLKPLITPPNATTTMAPFTTLDPFTTTMDPFTTSLGNFTDIMDTTTEPPDDYDQDYIDFKSKQYAMYLCTIVNFMGAIFFFWTCCYIAKDKEKCDLTIAQERARVRRLAAQGKDASGQSEKEEAAERY